MYCPKCGEVVEPVKEDVLIRLEDAFELLEISQGGKMITQLIGLLNKGFVQLDPTIKFLEKGGFVSVTRKDRKRIKVRSLDINFY